LDFADVAGKVAQLVADFGAIWKLGDADGLAAFVRERGGRVGPLLLFELAHEGSATEAMIDAARLGGIGEVFARWEGRVNM
jgi:hypothetical protein